ncbi:MAG: hypothetical protein ACFN4D_06270 [Cardiobacterium sp.]
MFTAELFLALSITSFLGLSAAPGIASDPALVTKLEQARPVMRGKNGYQALFELPLTNQEWPDELPKCDRYAQDCLAQAQQNLAAYRNALPKMENIWQQQEAAVEALRQYDYFLPQPGQYREGKALPGYATIYMGGNLHTYRFAAGERERALRGACRDTNLALRLLNSHGSVTQSALSVRIIERNIALLAQMRAELPPDAALPVDCDALRPQPAASLALCPLMYSEWLRIDEAADKPKWDWTPGNRAKTLGEQSANYWIWQTKSQQRYEMNKYCAPEIIAAVARDEIAMPDIDANPRYCSSLNILCKMAQANFKTYPGYQARLLNANRYLRAFELLQHPEAPLPSGYSRDGNAISFSLHPEKADAPEPTITLPLPGSRLNR